MIGALFEVVSGLFEALLDRVWRLDRREEKPAKRAPADDDAERSKAPK